MKTILIVMALGGYNGDTPALMQLETLNMVECSTIGQKIVGDLKRLVPTGWGSGELRDGPRKITFTCVELEEGR